MINLSRAVLGKLLPNFIGHLLRPFNNPFPERLLLRLLFPFFFPESLNLIENEPRNAVLFVLGEIVNPVECFG